MSCRGISTIGRLGLAALVALAFVLLALPAAASAAAAGAISGKVTQAIGGAGVQGAEACAETEGEVFDFECAETAADGSYEITGLEPAKYLVFFEAGNSGLWLIPEYYDGVSSWIDAEEVTVESGLTTPGIDASMVEGGAIAGRVTDALTGAPIREVEVCSRPQSFEGFDGCDYTATDGSYEIVGVAAGLHELEFWAFEGNYEPKLLPGVSVSVGVKTSNVNAALLREAPAEGRISGHVYAAATHAPLPNIAVCGIWAEYDETGGCTLTNGAGAYGFFPVPPGALKIVFSPEPAEVEFNAKAKADIWPTQYWNQKPTLAAADVLNVTSTSAFTNIDGLLGPGPPPVTSTGSTTPPATSTPAPVAIKPGPKPLHCGKGKVKKRVKGKTRCVTRHKPRRHHKKHHRNH